LRATTLVVVALSIFGCAALSKTSLQKAQDKELDKVLASKGLDTSRGDDPRTAEEGVAEGDRLLRSGDAQRAVVAYFKAVDMDPEAIEPRERIGFMQLSNDPERAEAIFIGLTKDDPERASAWRGLGFAHMANGELEKAAVALQRGIEIDPDSAGTQYGLASVMGLLGDSEGAVRHAQLAKALRPNDAAVANILGVSLMLADDLPAAEESLRNAVRLAPDMAAYHNNLGLVLGKQRHYSEAMHSFRRGGNEQASLNNLGYVYFLNGRYDEAIAHYENALSEPGDHKVEVLRNINEALDARDHSLASPRP
jgi:Flp pilus assembly protein TadD